MCLQLLTGLPLDPAPQQSRLNFLTKSLSSLVNFYEKLFSKALDTDMETNKREIEKELREFMAIYKWQEANYWSIKQSAEKSNRVLLRTMRKFKAYLRSPVDFERLIVKVSPPRPPISNHRLLIDYFKTDTNHDENSDKYVRKMVKFSRKLLGAKFTKNRVNRSIETLTTRISDRFSSLEKETRTLNSRYAGSAKDKEASAKLKKEFKYLNQEKLRFVSDLIKELTAIGNEQVF